MQEITSAELHEIEAGVVISLRDISLKPGCDSMFMWDKTTRSGLRHRAARGRLIVWCSFFKLYRPRTGWAKIFEEYAHTADNIGENSFACGNLSLAAPFLL